MNARLQALSMISSESRIVSGLRRISTPNAPVAKRKAATPRYQVISGPRMAPQHDAAHGGDEQHDRRTLERDQVVGEEQLADVGGAAEGRCDVGLVREPPAGLEPDGDDDLDENRAGRDH